jgi:hypothetical protein
MSDEEVLRPPVRTMTKLLIVGLIAVAVLSTWWIVAPHRSVEAYCSTFHNEGVKLHKQWNAQRQQMTNDPFAGLGLAFGSFDDIANFFDKLDQVAPDEIEPDVARLRDAYKQAAQNFSNSGGSQLDLLMGQQLILSLQVLGPEQRVNDWTTKNCPASTFTDS